MGRDKVFISRAGADADKAIAAWVAAALEGAGYSCVIQDRDFRIGASFPGAMREAFEQCDTTVALMSPAYWASKFCCDEWDAAYALDRSGRGKLIPVMARPTAPPRLVANLAYFDLANTPEGERARRLRMAVDGVVRGTSKLPDVLAPNVDPHTNASFETAHFTGRDRELGALHRALWGVDTAAALTQPAAVFGLGGIGKSAIGKEYVQRHLHRYCLAWLVRAEHQATMMHDLSALAQKLDPRLKGETDVNALAQQGAMQARRLAEQIRRPALIFLDNIAKPTDVPGWLKAPGLHLVLTSRYAAWPKGVVPVEVSELPLETAQALLLETANRQADEGVHVLLRELQGLPLALVQAGAYLRENPSESFANYAGNLARRIAEKADDWPADQKLLDSTYQPSIEKADASAPGARDMLQRASFYAPDDIPLSLLASDPDAEHARRARDALGRYSLWREGEGSALGQSFSIHRLVQVVLRKGLDEKALRAGCRTAAERLSSLLEGDPHDVRDWARIAPLAPHTSALSELTPDAEAGPDLAKSVTFIAGLAQARAGYDDAEPLYRRALAIYEASYGPGHPDVAMSLNNFAGLLHATNRADEAEPLYRRALVISEASYGSNHPNVAASLNNLAGLLRATNRADEAEPLYRRALAINEASCGPNHPQVATNLNNLASLLRATNRADEAEPLYRRALAIYQASYGPDHPRVAMSLNNLAGLLRATYRADGAEPLYRRALAIRVASYGQDHPHVATSLNNLASLLRATNRADEAEPLYRRALAIYQASYGPDHPDLATNLNNLAELLRDIGRTGEAEPLYRRALAIREASYGPDDPRTKTARSNLLAAQAVLAGKSAEQTATTAGGRPNPTPPSTAESGHAVAAARLQRRNDEIWIMWTIALVLLAGAGWAAVVWGPAVGFTVAADVVAAGSAAFGF